MSEKQLKEAARMVDVPVVKHELGKATARALGLLNRIDVRIIIAQMNSSRSYRLRALQRVMPVHIGL